MTKEHDTFDQQAKCLQETTKDMELGNNIAAQLVERTILLAGRLSLPSTQNQGFKSSIAATI